MREITMVVCTLKIMLLSSIFFVFLGCQPQTSVTREFNDQSKNVNRKIVELAVNEWIFFGKQTIDKKGNYKKRGHLETEDGYWQRVGLYWKEGTESSYNGKNVDVPWSSAFISYILHKAGVGRRFQYSILHADHIRRSISARKSQDKNYGFWGYRLQEYAPQVGDMVCYARQSDITYDTTSTRFISHTDIVVAVRSNRKEIDVIGGNVGDSVTLKTLKIDEKGHLVDTQYKWFVVQANRLDGK